MTLTNKFLHLCSPNGRFALPTTLRLERVCKRYGSRWVVDHVSLSVARGEVVGLLKQWCRENDNLLHGNGD